MDWRGSPQHRRVAHRSSKKAAWRKLSKCQTQRLKEFCHAVLKEPVTDRARWSSKDHGARKLLLILAREQRPAWRSVMSAPYNLALPAATSTSLTRPFTETQNARRSWLLGQKPVTRADGVVRLEDGSSLPVAIAHPAVSCQKAAKAKWSRVQGRHWEQRGQDSRQAGSRGG